MRPSPRRHGHRGRRRWILLFLRWWRIQQRNLTRRRHPVNLPTNPRPRRPRPHLPRHRPPNDYRRHSLRRPLLRPRRSIPPHRTGIRRSPTGIQLLRLQLPRHRHGPPRRKPPCIERRSRSGPGGRTGVEPRRSAGDVFGGDIIGVPRAVTAGHGNVRDGSPGGQVRGTVFDGTLFLCSGALVGSSFLNLLSRRSNSFRMAT